MDSESLTGALRETVALFEAGGQPRTASEVGETLDLGRRSAYARLERLADRGYLATKKVGASGRVWWRPAAAEGVDWWTREQFDSLVDAVEEYAIFALDPDGTVRSWNAGAALIKGYDDEEILGTHISTFYTRDDREAGVPEANLETAASTGTARDSGWRVRADGSRFRADVTLTAIRSESGTLRGFVKLTRDMTRRYEYEHRLRAERDFNRGIIETAPASIFVLDGSGTVVTANDRFREQLGLAGDEPARTVEDIAVYDESGVPVPPDDRPFRTVFRTGEPVTDWQCQIDLPSGERRWASVNAAPLTDDGGAVERVVVAAQDTTTLRRQTRQLERRRDDLKQQLDEVYRRIDDGVVALDEQFRFTYVNASGAALLDREEGELLGRRFIDVFPGIADTRFEAATLRAARTGEPATVEAYYEPMTTWFEASIYHSETGVSVFFRDVSERKRREQDLVRYETLFQESSDVNAVLDTTGRYRTVTPSIRSVLGYDPAEMVGEVGFDFVHPDDREQAWAEFTAMIADPSYEPCVEFRFAHADGSWVDLEVQARNLLTDPAVEGIVVYTRDVTERNARKRELERSRRRYRTLVEQFPNGAVALVDEELAYVTVGGTPIPEADTTIDEIEGEPLRDVLPPALAEELPERYEDAFDGRESAWECRVGDHVYQFHVVPVVDDDGEVFAAMGMSQDVTERVDREREIERQRRQLAALSAFNDVVHRTTTAVIEQSTRAEIEATVCEHLVRTTACSAASIGCTRPAVDGDHARGADGIRRDHSVDPRSSAGAIPVDADGASVEILLSHDEMTYGVLEVHTDRPDGFGAKERDVLTQLGDVVGHAIAASERKRALMSDEVVELEYSVPLADTDCPPTSGAITFGQVLPLGDDAFLVYGRVTDDATGALECLVERLPHWDRCRVRGGGRFELRLSEPPVMSALASVGVDVERAVIEDGAMALELQVAPGADVRTITETLRASYAGAELLRCQQITRRAASTARVREALDAGLTDRQRTAVAAAYHAGYFAWPREFSGTEVADSLGVAPPTFHQHLRKAERTVFDALFRSDDQPGDDLGPR